MTERTARKIPFLDLAAQTAPLRPRLLEAAERVLASGRYILGPEVEAFEARLASEVGVAHAVGVSSGTDALLVALSALGVGPGKKVITTSFSFVATAEAIARLGARPVFVDVEEGGFNLDVEQVARVLDQDVAAVLPVHLFGRMADMRRLLEVCGDVPVVEDAAQSLGARRDGLAAGAGGRLGCFSFFPTKNLGGFGDGGAVVCSDTTLAERIRALRTHGGRTKDRHELLGGNFRLDALQAALLGCQWEAWKDWTEARRRNARHYLDALGRLGLPIELPRPDTEQDVSVWNQFVILTERRDELRAHLAERGVATMVYYRTPLHEEPCFRGLAEVPVRPLRAERLSRMALALPVGPTLRGQDLDYVVGCVAEFFGKKTRGFSA